MDLIVTCCSLYLVMQICRIWIMSELHLLHSKIWVDMTGTFDPVINHMSENEDKGLILRENEVKVLVAQSCQTLCDPQDGSSSGFSVHGISQARIHGMGSHSRQRDQTRASCISLRFFIIWVIREAQFLRSSLTFKVDHISVQSLSRVWLFVTPWTAACQASLSITNSWSPPKPMSIESVMPSNHLILCCLLLVLPPVFPSIRVFSNESALCIKWPKYWSFSFNISPSDEHPGLISFRMDWMDLLAVRGTLESLLQHHSSKASINHRSLENQSISKKCLSGTDLYIVLWRNSGGIRNINKSPEGLSGQLCNLWI